MHVYYPVIHADNFTTFDMKLHELLNRKRELAERYVEWQSGKFAPVISIWLT